LSFVLFLFSFQTSFNKSAILIIIIITSVSVETRDGFQAFSS